MSLSDLQKKLEKESQGIMFPFSASASTVNTTQNVYDSATDGIMTMQGKKYIGIGPSAHSFSGESRSWNISNNSKYIQAIQSKSLPSEIEILSINDKKYNKIKS